MRLIFLIIFFNASWLSAQQIVTLNGEISDAANGESLVGAVVYIKQVEGGAVTNVYGFYSLSVPPGTYDVEFRYVGFNTQNMILKLTENMRLDIELEEIGKELKTVVVSANREDANISDVEMSTAKLDIKSILKVPTFAGEVDIIKSIQLLPGVSTVGEGASGFNVRGGGAGQNLVLLDEAPVYQTSHLFGFFSVFNPDAIKDIKLYKGGIPARYGGRVSSVLDISYRNPVSFGIRADLSLLGGSVAAETVSKDGKFSGIAGVRYRDNSLILNNLETEGNVEPVFADAQTYLTYRFSSKFHLNFLGNISLNKYNFQPENRQTNFGTLQEPVALLVFYDGQEKDEYQTYFGAFKANYFVNDDLTLKIIASAYHTVEQEYFDILAQYRLGEVNTNIGDEDLGEVEFSEGIGSQLTHARNNLDAFIINAEHRGDYKIDNESTVEWSIKYTHEDIRDRLVEYEVIDSAGFSIRSPNFSNPNLQPYEPFSGPRTSFENIRALNKVQI